MEQPAATGSCWAVPRPGALAWLQVRVEGREGEMEGQEVEGREVVVCCMDYGMALQVGRGELHRLPPGGARETDDLALCCRLPGRPGGELPQGNCTLLVARAGVLLVAGEADQSFLWNQLPVEPSRPQGGEEAKG